MINELFFMNGYEVYVLSAFGFTILSFTTLYLIIKIQFIKESNIRIINKNLNLTFRPYMV